MKILFVVKNEEIISILHETIDMILPEDYDYILFMRPDCMYLDKLNIQFLNLSDKSKKIFWKRLLDLCHTFQKNSLKEELSNKKDELHNVHIGLMIKSFDNANFGKIDD